MSGRDTYLTNLSELSSPFIFFSLQLEDATNHHRKFVR
jgi:hypothetical protein